jgi:nucleotide-binding universal stress UspA family protein
MVTPGITTSLAARAPQAAAALAVVVATDGGWGSRRAVERAAREAGRRGVGLVVVTVIRTPAVEPTGYAAWTRAERDAVEAATAVNDLAMFDVRQTWPRVLVEGIVASSVDDLASVATRAGLLVVGRTGALGQGVFRMGSTSAELLRAFGCPVLVCRDQRADPPSLSSPSPSRHPEVVAAVHRESEIPAVLRRAVQEAAVRCMPLCVFTSGPTRLEALVQATMRTEKSVQWRLVWTADGAAEALLRYAGPHDLLVLGNGGRERLAGHVTGSVSRAVLDRMPCDVMLVPL